MLKGMQDRDADRIARSALGAGASVVRKEMRRNAPEGPTKNLKKSIGSRLVRNRRKFVVQAKTGINVGKRTKKQIATRGKTHRAPHGHLVALGTKPRVRNRIGGKFSWVTSPTRAQLSTGKMPANSFVRDTSRSSLSRARQAMASKAREKIKLYNQRRRP